MAAILVTAIGQFVDGIAASILQTKTLRQNGTSLNAQVRRGSSVAPCSRS